MSEGPGGPQGATAGGTLAMRMLSQQAMVASQMKRAANDKAIAQMLAAKKSGPPAARLGDEIQHKSFLGALAGAVLGAIVTIAEGCLIMAACATGPYALVLVPALMYASYKASDYVEEKQNQLESWINSFCDTDGAINTGSENVNINGKPAARAAVTLPPPPPPGAIPEIPQEEPSWGDIATDLLESAAEKAVPLAKAWGNAVITLTESNAGFMDRVSAGASLLFPAGPVLMEFATMVGGHGEIKKDVDFPEAGEDTALCDKENKPPRIAQGSSNVFINNQPAARKGDKLECSAAIVEGSPDVFIGGEQVTYLDIQPEFPPWQRMILGGITIASYLLPPAGLLGKLGNLAKLGKLGNLLGKSGKLLGAKLGALLGKTGKSLKSIANKVIRWVTDPVDPVTGAYCDERTDFTLGQTLPLSFTRFHSSVLPLHGLTGVGWSDSWSEYAWVREQGNRVDIISLGATLNFAFDGESDTAVNPYHAQYILRRRDDYLELFDRDALSSRFFYDAFPGMRLRHPVTDDTSDDRLAHSPADRMYMLGGMSDTASNRITFERDSQYRITGVSHTDGIRLKLTYHASGYLKAIHRTDNGIQTLATYEQDARGRLTEADARLDYHLFYEYDAADRIIRWSDTPMNTPLPDVTFEEACLRWLEEKADKKSLDSDKSRIEFWLEHFEGIRLKDISEAKIYSAVSRMHNRKTKEIWKQKVQAAIRKGKELPVYEPKPVSTQTKAKHLAMIKAILRAAERDWKWLEKAPVIKIPAVRNKRVRWLEKEEAKRLIDECPEPLKSVVKFALATGLRKSNIINLEWQQIDMQRRVAWVNPEESKSNRAIGVALNDTACKVLRDQIGKHHKWVFVHTKAAKRADGTSTPAVRKMRIDSKTSWLSACRRAGIEDFRFHDLRHTWASWLIQSGVPLSVLQEMGGWESIEMVRRYAHLAPNHLTEHARKIDDIFGDNVPNMSHSGIMEDIKKA